MEIDKELFTFSGIEIQELLSCFLHIKIMLLDGIIEFGNHRKVCESEINSILSFLENRDGPKVYMYNSIVEWLGIAEEVARELKEYRGDDTKKVNASIAYPLIKSLYDSVMARCADNGHYSVDDMCSNPEHRYCLICEEITPNLETVY